MADFLRPVCYGAAYGTDLSAGPHGPHGCFPHSMSEAVPCRGWTAEEVGAVAMLRALDVAARPYAGRVPLHDWPDGAGVECHPLVLHAVRRVIMPSFAEIRDSGDPDDQHLLPCPVTVVPGMPRGAWRLVLVQGVIGDGDS